VDAAVVLFSSPIFAFGFLGVMLFLGVLSGAIVI
jgi:hypothetical protein